MKKNRENSKPKSINERENEKASKGFKRYNGSFSILTGSSVNYIFKCETVHIKLGTRLRYKIITNK